MIDREHIPPECQTKANFSTAESACRAKASEYADSKVGYDANGDLDLGAWSAEYDKSYDACMTDFCGSTSSGVSPLKGLKANPNVIDRIAAERAAEEDMRNDPPAKAETESNTGLILGVLGVAAAIGVGILVFGGKK